MTSIINDYFYIYEEVATIDCFIGSIIVIIYQYFNLELGRVTG